MGVHGALAGAAMVSHVSNVGQPPTRDLVQALAGERGREGRAAEECDG